MNRIAIVDMLKSELKNIISLASITAFIIIAVGFASVGAEGSDPPGTTVRRVETTNSQEQSSQEATPEETQEEPQYVINAQVPEQRCPGFILGTVVIFANSRGGYTIQDMAGTPHEVFHTDSEEGPVTFSCKNDELSMSQSPVTCKGHLIELTDGILYYDKSPVTYVDTAFSAYKLNDEYTVECTAPGKYILRNKKGETKNTCTITDDDGVKQLIYADEEGFMALNPDDLLEVCFWLHGDLIGITEHLKLYVNGVELVPPGANDIYTEGASTEPVISDTPLTATQAPAELGAVRTTNEGVSDATLEMLGYVNEFREKYGLPKLYGLKILDEAAETRAGELIARFSHDRPDERSYESVLDDLGLYWWSCSENIAFSGDTNALKIFDAWTRSEEHRANMLDPKAKYMALGVKVVPKSGYTETKVYWELLFLNDVYVSD